MECEDDQNSLSKEERKQKKEERRKKKKERLKDKQNSVDVEQTCDHAAQNTSPEVVTKSSKKKRKREKEHNSNSVCDETLCKRKKADHSINGDGTIKRQETDNIEQTTSCDASLEVIKSKKKNSKKEKTIPIDPPCDSNQLSEISQDIAQPVKKKNKKHKKSKGEDPDGENIMPANIDSILHEMDCGINHEIKSKKPNHRVHLNKDEEPEDTKHADSKGSHSRQTKEESSKKKKKKKHSKHKDCESVDETDSNIPRKKRKKKSKSCGDKVEDITEEHDSVETQQLKYVTSDANISNTVEENGSKHKKQKNHSKNSPTALDMVKNMNGKQEIGNEFAKHDKTSYNQVVKSDPSPDCAAVALGNWQGNLFESSERQNKFLRLLGGMKKSNNDTTGTNKGSATLTGIKKKGLFGSLASLSNTASSGSSVALDVNAAASLNQKLEDEYNKAMNFKLSGKVGTGFGFAPDPAEGKKFHIDVNKSKSVKFDDD